MSTYSVTVNGKEFSVSLEPDGPVNVDGIDRSIVVQPQSERTFSILLNGASRRIVVDRSGDSYQLLVDGTFCEATVESERTRLLKKFTARTGSSHRRTEVIAPMPALVVRVEVEVGQEVTAGQGLLILEAMKMENEIKAVAPGKVKEIFVEKGKPVEKGQRLIALE